MKVSILGNNIVKKALSECPSADLRSLYDSNVEKSRIRETKNLLTDADSRTKTILERLRDLFKNKKK